MPRTKESGIDERLALNRDFRDGYAAGLEATKAERDALRAFVERISWLDPQRGPVHVHAMVADAKRLVGRE